MQGKGKYCIVTKGVYNIMNEEILQKIEVQLSWYERWILKIAKKTVMKIYHIGRIDGINGML